MLLFEFRNGERSLSFNLVLGPGPRATRELVYDVAGNGPPFTLRRKMNKNWDSIYRKTILGGADYDSLDADEIKSKVTAVVAGFFKDDFSRIVTSIEEAFRR